MNILCKAIVLIPLILILCSCTSNNEIDKHDLIKYYETDKVKINIADKKVSLFVTNSPLIKRLNEKNEYVWETFEPYASIGAILLAVNKNLPSSIDSIFVEVANDNKTELYSYRLQDVKRVRKYVDVCRAFVNSVYEKDFNSAKGYFSNQILESTSSGKIDTLFSTLLLKEKVINSELIAMKIENQAATLYMNIVYPGNRAQTYQFNFLFNEDDKIVGIMDPYSN